MPKIAFESAEMNMNSRTWNSRPWNSRTWSARLSKIRADTERFANQLDKCLGNGGNKKSFAGDSPALSADPVADLQLATVRKLREVRCAMLVFLSLYECCWHFS